MAGIIALEHDASDVTVVWLGDYVDRGWQPLQTLDRVAAGLGQPGVEEIRLLGNHEVYLIEAATGEDLSLPRLLNWWRYGGEETLKTLAPDARLEDPLDLTAALNESLGPERPAFLQRLVLQRRLGDYLFVPPRLPPGPPHDAQTAHAMLWIRGTFLPG